MARRKIGNSLGKLVPHIIGAISEGKDVALLNYQDEDRPLVEEVEDRIRELSRQGGRVFSRQVPKRVSPGDLPDKLEVCSPNEYSNGEPGEAASLVLVDGGEVRSNSELYTVDVSYFRNK